jgi:molybdate transport repressor ModE-like protein
MLKTRLDASVRLGRDALYPVPHDLLALLRSIRVHGSLIHATKEAGISYRHAWGLLGRWEAITGQKLAVLTRGQGTGLTPFGARLAGIAEWLEPRIHERFDDLGAELARYLDVPVEGEKQRVLVHASNDIALLKLKERLDRHLAIDLRFEGSLNSLDSLARGDCDVAGFHVPEPPALLGPLLAEFSTRLRPREHYVVTLISRHQGFMMPKPLLRRVRGPQDLLRHGLRFVNRERGSGTRLLFDALLARERIAPSDIAGYEHEEFTHMATAATIRAGMADCAFGIEAAARTHGLAFLRLVTENYYLACRRGSPARIAVDTMVATAQSGAFQRAITKIGGYDCESAGARVQLSELFGRRPRR